MSSRTVLDGNAFYEIDEACLKQKKENQKKKQKEQKEQKEQLHRPNEDTRKGR